MPLAEKIRRWKGGTLRVYTNTRAMDKVGTDEQGRVLYEPRLERTFLGRTKAVPLAEGFAVESPTAIELFDPHVRLDFEVRQGRLELVGITSLPDGPGLTQTLVRHQGIWAAVKAFPHESVYRLELDSRGHVIGVRVFGPRERWDLRYWEEAVSDTARELGDAVPRPGRPRLTDAELRRFAEVHREAELSGQSTARAIAEEFTLTLDAAKKRIRRARDRGFLPKTEPRKARG